MTGTRKTRSGQAWLYAITGVLAACSILYELLLAQTLSALLGNTVLRYSITIGVYLGALGLGAMLCGRNGQRSPTARLVRIELILSVVGGLSVPLFFILDGLQRYIHEAGGALAMTAWGPSGFLVATHGVICAVGLLSGFEIPLLLHLGEHLEQGSSNKILGVDYFGSLVGAMLFPLILLPELGLFATAFVVALFNLAAGAALILWRRPRRLGRPIWLAAPLALALVTMAVKADRLEQHFLKTFYYRADVTDPLSWVRPVRGHPPVERVRSAYQAIDLVTDPDPDQWLTNLLLAEPVRADHDDLWLYLDGEFQIFTGAERFYHEWFAHVPVHAGGPTPSRVLVLGGGDGMLVRELLKYDQVLQVLQVELDPAMLHLARHHPVLSQLNAPAFRDARHEVAAADAFGWLRTHGGTFDAIFVDLPYPRDHNLSQVYSREFYTLIAAHLAPGGYLALDAPSGGCRSTDGLWPVYFNTLRDAGFAQVEQFTTRLDLNAPAVQRLLSEPASAATAGLPLSDRELLHETGPAYLVARLTEHLPEIDGHHFIVAYPTARSISRTMGDPRVEMKALRPTLFSLAFEPDCPRERRADVANSIIRPTLPLLELGTMRSL